MTAEVRLMWLLKLMNTDTTTSKPTIDWLTWFLWVLVCSLVPVINTLAATAFNKPILRTDPDAASINAGMSLLMLLPLTIPFLQSQVLRRISNINFVIWTIAILYAWFMYGLSSYYQPQVDRDFRIAIYDLRGNGLYKTPILEWLYLPWGKLLLQTFSVGFISLIVPSLILAGGSKRKWYFFLIAAIVGTFAENILNIIYNINFYRTYSYALNNMPWFERIEELIFRSSLEGIFGAVSGCVLLALFQYEDFKNITYSKYQIYRKPILMLGGAVLIAISAPVFVYLIKIFFERRF